MKERQFTIIVLLLVQYLCNSISDKKPHQGRIRKYRKVRVRVSEKKSLVFVATIQTLNFYQLVLYIVCYNMYVW